MGARTKGTQLSAGQALDGSSMVCLVPVSECSSDMAKTIRSFCSVVLAAAVRVTLPTFGNESNLYSNTSMCHPTHDARRWPASLACFFSISRQVCVSVILKPSLAAVPRETKTQDGERNLKPSPAHEGLSLSLHSNLHSGGFTCGNSNQNLDSKYYREYV
jgi:hypothetical protein